MQLHRIQDLPAHAARPDYEPALIGHGIVHFGVGAFHRAHQAQYTDAAISATKQDWRITGISLRSTQITDDLNAQNGLYTFLERTPDGPKAQIIGSIKSVLAATRSAKKVIDLLADPSTRVVTLTVTEKAYGVNREVMEIEHDHPAIMADLKNPDQPVGVIGFLCAGLKVRYENGIPPFTALSCDNLPDNGKLLKAGLISFARHFDEQFARWIMQHVKCPSCMVDRITPAATDDTRNDVKELIGMSDNCAIEAEPFSQWIIEDDFTLGRPAWDIAGALFVDDVAPYEKMKLRMLNGAHSLLAYSSVVIGHKFVRDALSDPALASMVATYLKSAASTLSPLPQIDFDDYAQQLLLRFSNPEIAHQTYQIAMDGTQKLPQRILNPAIAALENNQDIGSFAFATAAWMRYCLGRTDPIGTTTNTYELRDPREAEIKAALSGHKDAKSISAALFQLPNLFTPELSQSPKWREAVAEKLDRMITKGMSQALLRESQND